MNWVARTAQYWHRPKFATPAVQVLSCDPATKCCTPPWVELVGKPSARLAHLPPILEADLLAFAESR